MRGIGDLFRPAIGRVLLLGIGFTIALLVGVQVLIFWALRQIFAGPIHLPWWGDVVPGPALGWASLMLLPLMGFFLMAPVASAFSGLYAENVASQIEKIHYPSRKGQELDFWDGLMGSLGVMGAVLAIAVISLIATPFLGPLAPVLFYGANGWLLGREFFQMAARRHMDGESASNLRETVSGPVLALGIMIAFALSIPLVNIAVPVLAAASFTHLFHMLSGSANPSRERPRG